MLLSWTDNSNNEDGFKIERLVGGLVVATVTVPANTTSYVDSTSIDGTVCYQVKAFNAAGDSGSSNQACITAPTPVAGAGTSSSGTTTTTTASTTTASSSASSASVRLAWIDTSDNEDGFKIERLVGGLVQATMTVPANTTSYVDSTSAQTVCYRVTAFNSAGNSDPSNQSCITSETPVASAGTSSSGNSTPSSSTSSGASTTTTSTTTPTATTSTTTTTPTTSTTTAVTSGGAPSLRLAWIDTADNEDGFKIERLVAGLVEATMTVAANTNSYVDSASIKAGTVYCYRTIAFNAAGDSDPSNQSCTTAQEPVAPALSVSPTNVRAGATVTAMWTGIPAPTPKDWLGLYAAGSADAKFINRIYVSCAATPGASRPSGSCSYLLPATLSAGNYELRLFANDGFTRLASSSALAVSKSPGATPIVLANSVGKRSAADPGPLPKEWTDYDLRVNLRSMNSNSIGVIFRYQDDRNFYRFVWNQKSRFRRLEKIENGSITVLAKDATGYTKGRTYQAHIIAQRTTLRVLIDGAQIFLVNDAAFNEGTVGLYTSNNEASFDNIVVQDLNTGAVLLSDDFEDGAFNRWTIVDQGQKQGPSAWSVTSGSLQQTSDIDGTFALYNARDWTDYRFTAKLRSLDKGPMGVMFRYQGSNDYYRFFWDARAPLRRLDKIQNGVLTVLAKDGVPYVTGQTYNLEITAKGADLGVAIDGTTVFSIKDASLPKGTVALYSSYNPGSSFDDVLVQDLSTGTVLFSDNFNDGAFNGWTIVDEGTDQKPSLWTIKNGSFLQSNNIGSNSTANLGTYALY